MVAHINANWPAPTWIRAFTTTREMDLSKNSDDNRRELSQAFSITHPISWIRQTHSNQVAFVAPNIALPTEADAAWTFHPQLACVVLTGDCLPLLLCNESGSVIGAVHAGWKGLLNGVIENTVEAMRSKTQERLLAWMGPSIGPNCFEVERDVVDPCIQADPYARNAFIQQDKPGKWLGNIYELAKSRLRHIDIHHVYGGEYCTYTQGDKFYSARKTKTTCRMATMIWIDL